MTQRLPYQDPELSHQSRVRDLMARMSLAEKVGQMVQADGRKDAAQQVRERRVGSFLHILGEATVELQKLAAETGQGIPIIFGIDAIHGHGFWPGATVFPTQLALSCSWEPDLFETMARITAKEMLCTGLHWTFSPVLCLTRDLRWGRVGETCGEDPFLVGELAAAMVRGYQGKDVSSQHSVLACAKHFVGYSETVGGRDATESQLSRRRLRSEFMPPFKAMVEAGCRTFMTAYQCIDGEACAVSRWLLTEVLRDEWGFDGFVVTDWDNVGRAHKMQKLYPTIAAAVPDAVRAGNDMIMVTPEFYQSALQAALTGELDPLLIEQACSRVLTQKFALGLFDHKRYPPIERVPEVVGCDSHRAPLLDAALQSIVLLKNGADPKSPTKSLLPLESRHKKIAVLGPNADDSLSQLGDWSFGSGQASLDTGGHPRHLVKTVLDGVAERAAVAGARVDYCRGCEVLSSDASEIAEAVALALAADVAVVVVGDVLEQTGEECDRSELELTGGQLALLAAVKATGTPLVAVLINSKPLCISWLEEHADAVVEAFNPGMLGGAALARLLFGDDNFSGKLTVSFPRSLGEQPVYYQQLPGWHGSKYKNYDPTPLYAFGYGLSYTKFEYSELSVDTDVLKVGQSLKFSVKLTNVGERTGSEIVQVYINDVYTSLSTPEKSLKAYRRVELVPGESQLLDFELTAAQFEFVGKNEQLTTELGQFELFVGGSSRDPDLLRAPFEIA